MTSHARGSGVARTSHPEPGGGLRIAAAFDVLLAAYGPQHWWPARTAFEVVVGAVLTQNTAWTNVERAIRNLRGARALSLRGLRALPAERLEELIRPAGYFRQKARALRAVADFVQASGGLARLARRPIVEARRDLLAVRGVGPETADSILLYALGRPVFVVDAYTRRIFERLGVLWGGEPYEEVRALFEAAMSQDAAALNELHALLVEHAKRHCRKTPVCEGCGVRRGCGYASPV